MALPAWCAPPAGLGYDLEEDEARADDQTQLIWVADTAAEFVWRWWADNYAFAQANPEYCPQLRAPGWFDLAVYTSGYRRSRNG